MNTSETITSGNSAVVIRNQDGFIWAVLFVNARNGLADADITGLKWTGSTMAGARKWAAKVMK